jgi:hypothetical protein
MSSVDSATDIPGSQGLKTTGAFCHRIGGVNTERVAQSQGGQRISQISVREGNNTQRDSKGGDASLTSFNFLSQNLPSINYSDKQQILNELKGYRYRKSWQKKEI